MNYLRILSVKNLALTFLSLLLSSSAYSQYKIEYRWYPNNPDSNIVSFIDTTKNHVVRTFTLVKYNPYWNLSFPWIESTYINLDGKEYIISDTANISGMIPGLVTYEFAKKSFPKEARTYSQIDFSPQIQYAIIEHTMLIFSQEYLFGYASTLYIYNTLGELVHTLVSSDAEIISPCITDDGKYLAYQYGMDIEDGFISKNGYRVNDLRDCRIIDNQEVPEIYGLFSLNNFIVANTRLDYSDYSNFYMDFFSFKDNKKYSIVIEKDSLYNIDQITPEGVQIEYKEKDLLKSRFLNFDQKFSSAEIWK